MFAILTKLQPLTFGCCETDALFDSNSSANTIPNTSNLLI